MSDINLEKQEEKDLKKKAKRSRKRVYEASAEPFVEENEGRTNKAEEKSKSFKEKKKTVAKKKAAAKKPLKKEVKEKEDKTETAKAAPKKKAAKKKAPVKSKPVKPVDMEATDGEIPAEDPVLEKQSVEEKTVETGEVFAKRREDEPEGNGKVLEEPKAADPELEHLELATVEKKKKAMGIINRYVVLSSGTALIPMPLVDLAASTGLQIKMLKDLCDVYEIPFSEHRVKAILTSLISGYHVGLFAGSFSKLIPLISLAGVVMSMFLVSGAVTYAVGMLFMYHFGKGGTLKDFNPDENKENFKRHLKAGKESLKNAA